MSGDADMASLEAGQARSLLDFLRARSAKHPNKTAFTFLVSDTETVSTTYGELEQRVERVARGLLRCARPGDRALLLFPSGIGFIEAFLGCLRAGVVAVPAYPPEPGMLKSSLPRLRAIVEDCAPSVTLASSAICALRDTLLAELPLLGACAWACPDAAEFSSLDQPLPAQPGHYPAFLQYTSGSTSRPKGVVVSHENLIDNQRVIAQHGTLRPSDVCVGWLPLYHDMGLIGNVLQTIHTGMSCVWMSSARFLQRPARWLRAISEHAGTVSGSPNFAYELCASRISTEEMQGLDLSRWRVAFNGAEALRAGTLRRFSQRFASAGFRPSAFFLCYGLAESTLLVSGQLGEPVLKRVDRAAYQHGLIVAATADEASGLELVSSGAIDASARVEIVDPESRQPAAAERIGEIWLRSPSVARGYWGAVEASERTFKAKLADSEEGPFLRTGDLGFVENGQLFISGRLKDLIIVRGRKLHPEDIELSLERCDPALRPGAIAVFGYERSGEERIGVVAGVDLAQAAAAPRAIAEIRKRITEHHHVQPHAIVLIRPGTFPRTSSGKVQRHACRDGFLNQQLQTVAEWAASDEPATAPPSARSSESAMPFARREQST